MSEVMRESAAKADSGSDLNEEHSLSSKTDLDVILNLGLNLEDLKKFLIKNPDVIPEEAIRERLIDDVVEDTNRVLVSGGSEHAEYLAKHPEYAWRVRQIIESYAMVNKLRLVDDLNISESIREAKERQKENNKRGFFARVCRAALNQDHTTVLIKHYENLAAEVAALEAFKLKLKKENKLSEEGAAQILKDAEARAAEIIKNAEIKQEDMQRASLCDVQKAQGHAAQVLEQASVQSAKMTSDALSAVQTLTRETGERISLERKEAVAKISELERRIREAEDELRDKKLLLDQLNANPNLLEAWKHEKASNSQEEKDDREDIKAKAKALISAENRYHFCADTNQLLKNISRVFCFARPILIEAMVNFDAKYGKNKRSNLAACLFGVLNKGLEGSYYFQLKGQVSTTVNLVSIVQDFCEQLVNTNVDIKMIVAEFDEKYTVDGEVSWDKLIGVKPQEANKLSADIQTQLAFYQQVFNIQPDISKLKLPEKQNGFDWLLLVPQGLTHNQVLAKCRERFGKVSSSYDNLDEIFSGGQGFNARDPNKEGAYVIYLRNCIEADAELKNVSADDIKAQNITTVTLFERLLLELWYHWQNKKHLDHATWTLCAGSRYHDGSVPGVGWNGGGLYVSWRHASHRDPDLRARAAVSFS